MTVKVVGLSTGEAGKYQNYIENKYKGRELEMITIEADGSFVNISYKFKPVPFERVRRITGYLVGKMDRWNDAKKAEEADRVKHYG